MPKGKKPDNLLVDYFLIDSIKLVESKLEDSKSIQTFEAFAQQADKKNLNKRVYPKKVLLNSLGKAAPKIKRGAIFNLVDHPGMWEFPSLMKVGAVVTDAILEKDTGKVIISGKFLDDDPTSQKIKSILEAGGFVGISARGTGSSKYDEKTDTYTIQDDYEIQGWDFVLDPAVSNAKITHFENLNVEDNTMEIKNLDELRAAFPAFIVELEKPFKDSVDRLTVTSTEKDTEIANLRTKLDEGVKVMSELKVTLDSTSAELATIKTTLADEKFKGELAGLLKDNKFAEFIVMPSTVKTIEDATSFIALETERLEKVLGKFATTEPKKLDEKIEEKDPKVEDKKIAPEKTKWESYIDTCIDLGKSKKLTV